MIYTIASLLLSAPLYIEDLVVPDGFKIELYAENVVNARQMTLGDDGTIFVGTRKEGKVYALTGGPGDKCIANGNTWSDSVVGEDN